MELKPGEHIPVLLNEVLENLVHTTSGTYIDATFGRGGHCRAMLARLDSDARVYGLDRDPQAVEAGQALAQEDVRFSMCHATFGELDRVLDGRGVDAVDGVLMDVGVSSPQLDESARGFSFSHDGPLDMRMDPTSGQSAADWLNHAEQDEIAYVLKVHGEERFARRIAGAIVRGRPLHRTAQLAEVVRGSVSQVQWHKSAARTFQAIRIYINAEDEQLRSGLQQAFARLRTGGRLAVISFHSLEDRVVKQQFRSWSQPLALPRRLPLPAQEIATAGRLVGRAQRPGESELAANPRSRSATLRVIERLQGAADG